MLLFILWLFKFDISIGLRNESFVLFVSIGGNIWFSQWKCLTLQQKGGEAVNAWEIAS